MVSFSCYENSQEENMADIVYENIVQLTDEEIQMLLREVDTKDLALVMLGSGEDINGRYFSNVSDRVANMLREEMTRLGTPSSDDVVAVQSQIVGTLNQLRAAQVVRWPKSDMN
jgi:flagellar motor switch protein FliG